VQRSFHTRPRSDKGGAIEEAISGSREEAQTRLGGIVARHQLSRPDAKEQRSSTGVGSI
jgi:hypothetical protein